MQMIWALVRSGIFPNATQMARYMEISTKSIHRDLEFMREQLGFDIRYDAGRFGYYTPEGPVRCPFCEPDRKISSPAIAALRKPLVTFYGRCVGEKV
jgi:predicted DNA-binding transcriptional regulator YafY